MQTEEWNPWGNFRQERVNSLDVQAEIHEYRALRTEEKVPGQTQATVQVRSRAQVPVITLNVRPAFVFELYYLARRKMCKADWMDWTITRERTEAKERSAVFSCTVCTICTH